MAFSTHDIVPDSPTNNFATLNPLIGSLTGTMADGNLKYTISSGHDGIGSNFYVSSGKYYWETYFVSNWNELFVGISSIDEPLYESSNIGNYNYKNTIRYFSYNGKIYYHNGTTSSNAPYGNTFAPLDIIGVFLNLDDNELYFYKNGIVQNSGTPISIDSSTYALGSLTIRARYDDGGQTYNPSSVFVVNFGQDPTFGGNKSPTTTYPDSVGYGLFYYDPTQIASDVKALCTANLPEMTPDVTGDVPQDYFKAVKYVGDYSSPATISVGFNPDLVWIKQRTPYAGQSHCIYDSVRGVSKRLYSDSTSQEITPDGNGGVTNFSDNNGFELTRPTNSAFEGFDSSMQMIAWCWKAGGSPSATDDGNGVSDSAKLVNTSGVASSTTCKSFKDAAVTAGASNVICPSKMSINQAAGFSIVTYTGNGTSNISIPHGLGKKPSLLIGKNYDNSGSNYHWQAHFFYDTNSREVGYLNLTNAFGVDTTRAVNDNIIEIGAGDINRSTGKNIAYIWSEISGYSSFGKWTGDGSTGNGLFIYTGFRPAFILWQNSDSGTGAWGLIDGTRDPYNPVGTYLYANTPTDESTTTTANDMDFLSNGFKLRGTGGSVTTGEVCWYAAFAEQPFKYANAR